MPEQLTLRYIPLTDAKRWDKNPKKHDIGAICRSIELHGFRDPPAYDAALDGFAEGNGRTDALEALWQQKRPAPAYIAVDGAGVWHLPVIFGADSVSRAAAESYGIDHNNLTMSGGDFAAWDIAKLWSEDEYTTLLKELAEQDMMPVSVDGDDLDTLLGGVAEPGELWKGMPEFEQEDVNDKYKSLIVHFATQEDYEAFARLIEQTLTPQSNFIWYPYRPTHGVSGSMQGYTVENES